MNPIKLVKSIVRERKKSKSRSPGWNDLRDQHIKNNPVCAACGTAKMLHVHHIMPFNENPLLELDPDNLITLCGINDCHINLGHGGSYRFYFPYIRQLCSDLKSSAISRRDARKIARQNRFKNDGILGS
jgi:hypothetical protein